MDVRTECPILHQQYWRQEVKAFMWDGLHLVLKQEGLK